MPLYDYRCRTCGTVYEERRSMGAADEPATCPEGHVGAMRLLPVFATVSASGAEGVGPGACGSPAGGYCGAGCACQPG